LKPDEFKQVQKALGFNNSEMAEALCVSITAIESWRSGRRNISDRMSNAVRLLQEVEKQKADRDRRRRRKEN